MPEPVGTHTVAWLRRRHHLNTVIDIDSYGNIKELVRGGFGYSILPANAIAREVEAKE
ncbi:hypothetical protein JF546_22005, partial [Nitratireductor aquimarinus]|nr:hypothetical protein [Nitratireductor aquimarinus]